MSTTSTALILRAPLWALWEALRWWYRALAGGLRLRKPEAGERRGELLDLHIELPGGERAERAGQAALELLDSINDGYLQASPAPPLMLSGIRYGHEPQEVWQSIPALLRSGVGDCEDLASYLAAELRSQGLAARARALPRGVYGGTRAYHVVTELACGERIDPSEMLGME